METLDNVYRLQVGDQINYRVVEDRDSSVGLVVMESGEVNVPYLGRVRARGLTCRQLAEAIKSRLEQDLYHQATVLIQIDTERKTRGKVYVFGGVVRQGTVDLPVDEVVTVSKAILKSGGFSAGANRSEVRVERNRDGNRQSRTVDVAAILDRGRSELDLVLEPNDFVVVGQVGEGGRVFVSGEVGRPGPVEMRGAEFKLSEAILAAGGFGKFADQRKVRVVRKEGEDTREFVVDVKAVLDEGALDRDFVLQPEDRVIVRARLINF
ncbi:MAG: polysaccharide biosynthesis/export family protein [Candidatus Methylacidiphilales bacterium]